MLYFNVSNCRLIQVRKVVESLFTKFILNVVNVSFCLLSYGPTLYSTITVDGMNVLIVKDWKLSSDSDLFYTNEP